MQACLAGGGGIRQIEAGAWRLEIPAGPAGRYRVAQLDDYGRRKRRDFPWRAPFIMQLEARASSIDSPGTWGFGLWNDPFGMAVLGGGELLRLPVLPNTAWFFFAAPQNYLSLRDDWPAVGGQPAHGALAGVFRSPRWPSWLLAPGALALPLLLLPPAARLLRRLARRIVREQAAALDIDPTAWHTYQIEWKPQGVKFSVDGKSVLETPLAPQLPLGAVLWIDNQYAEFTPQGKVGYGMLAGEQEEWVEVRGLACGIP